MLRRQGALGPAESDDQAAATIFAIGHPEVYRSLTSGAGWSAADYRAWLGASLTAALAASQP
jgi:hypothetical protein